MAESEDPTNPSPEEPKPTEPKSMAARTEPSEGEATTVAGEERPSGVVSKETGPKPPTPEAKPTGKPVKKAARKKKEEPTLSRRRPRAFRFRLRLRNQRSSRPRAARIFIRVSRTFSRHLTIRLLRSLT